MTRADSVPPSDAPPRLAAGEVMGGRFTLVSELTDAVWVAQDQEGEQEVVLYFIPAALWLEPGLRADLLREVGRNSRLIHPAALKVYGVEIFGDEEKLAALKLEIVRGEPLAALLAREGRLSPERIIPWALQICEALEEAYEKEALIHRDLDPARIVVTPRGEIKLSDFGVTSLLRSFSGDAPTSSVPSSSFCSPQQTAGEPSSPTDDSFSLGVLLSTLLLGKPMAAGDDAASLPEPWRGVISACLSLDPALRPASFHLIRQQLEGDAAQEGAPTAPATLQPDSSPSVDAPEPVVPAVMTPEPDLEPTLEPAPPAAGTIAQAPQPQRQPRRSALVPLLTLLLLAAGGGAAWWLGVEQPRRDAGHRARLTEEQDKLAKAQQQIEATRADLERIAQEKAAIEASAAENVVARTKAEAAAAAAFRSAAEEKATHADRLAREAVALLESVESERSPERDARLFLLFREASELGHPEASAYLGGLYLDGRGTERKPEEARRLLEKAAKRNGYAQWRLGTLYEEGDTSIGIEKDREKAIDYYRRAADQGQPGALHRLAEVQLDSDDPQKVAEAVAWMTEAALGGYAEAQSRLGVIYGTGAGVKVDQETAFRWLDRAEEQKWRVEDDYLMVASWHHLNSGMSDTALLWYRKTAERGNLDAQIELATHHLNQAPLTISDLTEAQEWLEKAAHQGDEKTTALLKVLSEVTTPSE